MERKFLQNFKVGDQSLTKEIIDAIMAENGRDIEAAKQPFADYETVKNQLAEAQKTIKGFQDQGADIETIRKSAKDWEDKYNKAIEDHKNQLADMAFDRALDTAITGARGRNSKAIKALLDMDTLKGSKNQDADIKTALEGLKKDSGYLFEEAGTPPPYSAGAGTGGTGGKDTGGFNFGFTGVRAHETGK
ncbi:MAG: phage scaffolding protein [Oscillospiraceae bacterium]|nr:phage scaffolding protein [Oscillospiraceae bacterium]